MKLERNTAYQLDDIVYTYSGVKLKCSVAGTTSTNPFVLSGTTIIDGTVTWEVQSTELPIATQNVLGGIKVGSNLSITQDGVLSSTGGGSGGSVVSVETVLYEGTDYHNDIEHDTTYTLSDSIDNYDYLLVRFSAYENTSTIVPKSVTTLVENPYNIDNEPIQFCFSYNNQGNGDQGYRYDGWFKFPTNTSIFFALRCIGVSIKNVYIESIKGIKFVQSGGIIDFHIVENDMLNCVSLLRFADDTDIVKDDIVNSDFTWQAEEGLNLTDTETKYEEKSLYATGALKIYSECDDKLIELFTSGFTIDFWCYAESYSNGNALYIGTMDGGDAYQILELYPSGQQVYVHTQHVDRGHINVSTGEWHYWSLNFINDELHVYIDGEGLLTCPCPYNSNVSNCLYINAGRTSGRYMNGYISDFRITSYCRHIDSDFVVPSSAPSVTLNPTSTFVYNNIYKDSETNSVYVCNTQSNPYIFRPSDFIKLSQ